MASLVPLELQDGGEVRARIADHLAGRRALTGLELYYALERATPLLEFHTMLRGGPRNQEANGLQQSYGDHNRLLLLGLDKLLEGDVAWLRSRVPASTDVSDDDLRACVAAVRALGLDAATQVALWLGAALHDCGMLAGRSADLDVEDGIALARPLLDDLCPAALLEVAAFALRHHDYIKDVFTGCVPVALVGEALAALAPEQQPVALGALGMIQVAGAASLGTGRLTAYRMEIFRRCADGTALDDRSPGLRLARLLQPGETEHVGAAIDAPPALVPLLERVALHGWQRAAAGLDEPSRRATLAAIAERWSAEPVERIVLTGPDSLDPAATARRETTLSGTEVLVLAP
jgi:hypothetical protein